MPNYDFLCGKCQSKYDDLVPYDETGKYKNVKCPDCGSKKKTLMPSVCAFQFAQPEGTDRWNNTSSGHGYRFHHNLPKVIEERKQAEIMSHMGATPYTDTSEKDIQMDTGIHDAESRQGLS
jgi:putative FmdB family regulatory protein